MKYLGAGSTLYTDKGDGNGLITDQKTVDTSARVPAASMQATIVYRDRQEHWAETAVGT